jgi:YD repeat-containing protein
MKKTRKETKKSSLPTLTRLPLQSRLPCRAMRATGPITAVARRGRCARAARRAAVPTDARKVLLLLLSFSARARRSDACLLSPTPAPCRAQVRSTEHGFGGGARRAAPGGKGAAQQDKGVTQVRNLGGEELNVTRGGIFHSSGKQVTFTRDALGRITAIKDPAGKSMTYATDVNGDLASFTDRTAAVTQFSYAANHYL